MNSSLQRQGTLRRGRISGGSHCAGTLHAAVIAAAFASWLVAAGPAGAQTTATSPAATTAPAASAENAMACESLRHSIVELSVTKMPARAERMIALSRFADEFVPGDCRTKLLLARIYEIQGKAPMAAAELRPCLEASPADHVLGIRWLTQKDKTAEEAEKRIATLKAIIADQTLTESLRADAAAMCAETLVMVGNRPEALKVAEASLKLDPNQPRAIRYRLGLAPNTTALDAVEGMLNTLKGNPTDRNAAVQTASLLDDAGVYDRALDFYDYSWKIIQLRKQEDTSRETLTFLTQYFNGLLDGAQALQKGGPASGPSSRPGASGPAPKPSPVVAATFPADGETPIKGGLIDFVPSEAQAAAARRAIELFEPIVKKYPQSVDLQALMVEAYRAVGDRQKADAAVKAMEASYVEKTKDSVMLSSNLAAEMAWFYIMTLPEQAKALELAQKAVSINTTDLGIQRVVGAVELASPKADVRQVGVKRLAPLVPTDAYAAVLLAEYDLANGDKDGFMDMARSITQRGRSGPAFRRLWQLANNAGIGLPLSKEARTAQDEMRKKLSQFDGRYLEMVLAPEKFVSVTVKPVSAVVSVGEPIEVEAVLTNINDLKIPLGDWGLFNPIVGFKVLPPKGDKAGPFTDLPLAVWPAPRYLAKGQSVSCKARLDMGALASYLDSRPMDDVTITVESMVQPTEKNAKFNSSLPELRVEPVTITRSSLLELAGAADRSNDAEMVKAYKTMLGVITQKDILRGDVAQRMLAARRVAALLSYAQTVESNKATLPKALAGTFDRLVILAMFQALLKDPSPAVRAEAVAAMDGLAPDEHVVSLVRRLVDDPSELVRLRVAELLGANWPKRAQGQDKILEQLAADKNLMVKMMAAAFRAPEKPQ